jgi:hypothetical protein
MGNWLRFVTGQLAAMSPVLVGLLWVALARPSSLADGEPSAAVRRAWRLSLTVLAPTVLMCLFTNEAEPHWPVLGYLPILGPWAAAMWQRRPNWLAAAILVGVCLQAALWVHLATPWFVKALPDDYDRRADLSGDLYGWDQVGTEARHAIRRGDVQRVAASHYTLCGQLAKAPDLDLTSVVCLSDRRDAFDFLREGKAGRATEGGDLLFVRDNRYTDAGPDLLECAGWEPERRLEARRGGVVVHWFGLRVCRGYIGRAGDG